MRSVVVKVRIETPDWLFRLGEIASVTGQILGYELTPEDAGAEDGLPLPEEQPSV